MDQKQSTPAWTSVQLAHGFVLELANEDQRNAIIELLKENQLPVSDLGDSVKLFALSRQQRLLGSAGLELYGNSALLRSMSIAENSKGLGLGRQVCRALEAMARQAGISNLYLLTTTAAGFFEKLGYKAVSREQLPADVLTSAQFHDVCPASATLMTKTL